MSAGPEPVFLHYSGMDILLEWREYFRCGVPVIVMTEAKIASFIKIHKEVRKYHMSYFGCLYHVLVSKVGLVKYPLNLVNQFCVNAPPPTHTHTDKLHRKDMKK